MAANSTNSPRQHQPSLATVSKSLQVKNGTLSSRWMQLAQFGLQGLAVAKDLTYIQCMYIAAVWLQRGLCHLNSWISPNFPSFALLFGSLQWRVLRAPTACVPQAQMLIKSLGKGHSVHRKARFNLYNLQSSFSKQWARSIFCILNFSISVYSFTLTAKLLPGMEINYQHLLKNTFKFLCWSCIKANL